MLCLSCFIVNLLKVEVKLASIIVGLHRIVRVSVNIICDEPVSRREIAHFQIVGPGLLSDLRVKIGDCLCLTVRRMKGEGIQL